MEKNTVFAIILSSLVLLGWLFLQPILFPPPPLPPPVSESPVQPAAPSGSSDEPAGLDSGAIISPGVPSTQIVTGIESDLIESGLIEEPEAESITEPEERIVIETDLIRAELSSHGGDMVSFRLKEHLDKGDMVEMILPSIDENGIANKSRAFTIAFGGQFALPTAAPFRVSRTSDLEVEFARDFYLKGPSNAQNADGEDAAPSTFTLTKKYEFREGEYMFRLTVSINSPSGPLNFDNASYTLGFGPQIGPAFQKLDPRYDYRNYYTMINGKRSNAKVNTINDSRFTWAAIAGKYFTAILIPDNTLYGLCFSDKPEPGIASASRMYLIRPTMNSGQTNDEYHFYIGPKTQDILKRYDNGDNSFRFRDMDFSKAANTSGILSPLESLLKWLLLICYKLVKNYGVAIILLTLLVKVALFPLTKKSSEASIKMQALAPKIKEIQAKYKDNPAKMNAELGALYKKEGHNPLSGCLPMLVQLPLLFAMYNLFNNHFDLRGAMFIPGWIPDLSLPESIYNFDSPVPVLGWDCLRLLPFIYVGSQMLYGLATRTPEQQGNATMKMMMYVMPIVFFFVLYNVPSGLLVFWIMSNLFTLVQQVLLNKYMAKKKAAAKALEPEPVIAPRRKKKK